MSDVQRTCGYQDTELTEANDLSFRRFWRCYRISRREFSFVAAALHKQVKM